MREKKHGVRCTLRLHLGFSEAQTHTIHKDSCISPRTSCACPLSHSVTNHLRGVWRKIGVSIAGSSDPPLCYYPVCGAWPAGARIHKRHMTQKGEALEMRRATDVSRVCASLVSAVRARHRATGCGDGANRVGFARTHPPSVSTHIPSGAQACPALPVACNVACV
jgi:hypothetical protein